MTAGFLSSDEERRWKSAGAPVDGNGNAVVPPDCRLAKIRERLANLKAFGKWGISREVSLTHYEEDVAYLLSLIERTEH